MIKQVRPSTGTAVYPHMPRASIAVLPTDASPLQWRTERSQWRGLAFIGNTCSRAPIRPILGFWGAKFPKMGDSLPRTPLSHCAKFDAASFMLAGEIRNRTKLQNKQTVNDISAPCQSACVNNNYIMHAKHLHIIIIIIIITTLKCCCQCLLVSMLLAHIITIK